MQIGTARSGELSRLAEAVPEEVPGVHRRRFCGPQDLCGQAAPCDRRQPLAAADPPGNEAKPSLEPWLLDAS